MIHDSCIDVPLTRNQIEALLVGTDADRLADARRVLRAALAFDQARRLIVETRGPRPERRARDRRGGGSHHVAQMLDHTCEH